MQIETLLRDLSETKEKLKLFNGDNTHKQVLKNQQIVLNQHLMELNKYFSQILSLNDEILKKLNEATPLVTTPKDKKPSTEPTPVKVETKIDMNRDSSDISRMDHSILKKESSLLTDPIPSKLDPIKKSSPSQPTSGSMSLDDLLTPPKLDDILGSEENFTKLPQPNGNQKSKTLDSVLNMPKEDIITFKDEKTSMILNLFEEKKEIKEEKKVEESKGSGSKNLFDFI